MVARLYTVSLEGIDTTAVEVEVHIAAGMPAFTIVGLPDKAVAESRERVRVAVQALGLALPAKRITVNLAPAQQRRQSF
jgi:magnesium chelatase family protein